MAQRAVCALSVSPAPSSYYGMTAARVIEEIDDLPPEEQAKVIQHALRLARTRQLSADELGGLADRLAVAEDPGEIIRLKSAMTRGFYGE